MRQFYDLSSEWGWTGSWIKPISAMADLVRYLEEVVDFPPQPVFTSHEDLVFGQSDPHRWLVRVHPLGESPWFHPYNARFEISYSAQPPWARTVGYAETVEQAWHMIESRLQLNYPAPEKRQ